MVYIITSKNSTLLERFRDKYSSWFFCLL